MNKDFKMQLELIETININELVNLKNALEKLKKYTCRGEVNIKDTDGNLLMQTHYEDFIVGLNKELIGLVRYDPKIDSETLDYTHIKTECIDEYSIDDTSITFYGKFSDGLKFSVLIVFYQPKKK